MMKLKGCPRCGGDLFIDENRDGRSEQCLQCGFEKEMKPVFQSAQKSRLTETTGRSMQSP
jgi:hypothetical protein